MDKLGGTFVAEMLSKRDIREKTEEPVMNPVDTSEGTEKHELYIGAPSRIIAGEPFEVIVTVVGISSITYQQPHKERVELYLNNKLLGSRELMPLKNEEMESIFKIGPEEGSLAINEIETSRANEENLREQSRDKTVITNLRARVNCNIHGVSEATRKLEVLPEKYKETEEVKNVFVKPEDRKESIGNGP